MEFYSKTLLDHFMHPRNVGTLEHADAHGSVCDEAHSATFSFFFKIDNDSIVDVTFQTYGCAPSIAASSAMTELLKEKSLAAALTVSSQDLISALGGIPESKMFSIEAVLACVHTAITSYQEKHNG